MNQEEIWNKIALEWSKYRDRPIEEVERFLKNKKGRLLDLGCGSGRNMTGQEGLEYYGLDFSNNMVNLAKTKSEKLGIKARISKSSLEKLNFDDDFFDYAIFISSLHCIEGEKARKKALLELYRVLKINGEAMITVWDKSQNEELSKIESKDAFIDWKKGDQTFKRYYYFYDQDELIYLLKEVGFEITKVESSFTTNQSHTKKNIVVFVKKI